VSTVPSYRVGLIVPSSNVTMETEIPALLRAYEMTGGASFTFHGARMRMKKVTAESLLAMDREGATCAAYLADAQMDVMAYACLIAVMVQGARAHEAVAERLRAATVESGFEARIDPERLRGDGIWELGVQVRARGLRRRRSRFVVDAPRVESAVDVKDGDRMLRVAATTFGRVRVSRSARWMTVRAMRRDGEAVELTHLGGPEGGDDQQHAVGPHDPGVAHVVGADGEVLAQQREGGHRPRRPQIGDRATEVVVVGEHRQGRRAPILVAHGHVGGVELRGEVALGR